MCGAELVKMMLMKIKRLNPIIPVAYRLLASAALTLTFFSTTSYSVFAAPSAIRFTVNRFLVEGETPLTTSALEAYFQPLQNKQYTLKDLQAVSRQLETTLREQGYPFYRVVLPPQTLSAGTVTFRIVSFALGDLTVTGNHYFSTENILRSLPGLQKSASPNMQELSAELKVANKHPSKQVQVTFKPSDGKDQINASVNVNEQRPYQASLIFNTVGTRQTGNIRMTGALQYSNLWDLDHVLSGSYATSPDHADSISQYGVNYSMPIYPAKAWLNAYYAFSDANNGVIGDYNISGSGEMYGIHYSQYLPKIGQYHHWFEIGLDNRFFINDVQFLNIPIGSNVRSVPISLQYKGEYPWTNAQLSYYLQWLGNTEIGDYNSAQDYQNSRGGARQDWSILRYGSTLSVNWQRWLIQTTFIGQHSDDRLIAGEQLGIGGSYDVRGYQERETSADSGQIVKLEVTTPSWQNFNLFAFYDYGHGTINQASPGVRSDWNLSSTGAGAAWQWRNNFQAKIAVANALNNAVTTHPGDARIHASIVLHY